MLSDQNLWFLQDVKLILDPLQSRAVHLERRLTSTPSPSAERSGKGSDQRGSLRTHCPSHVEDPCFYGWLTRPGPTPTLNYPVALRPDLRRHPWVLWVPRPTVRCLYFRWSHSYSVSTSYKTQVRVTTTVLWVLSQKVSTNFVQRTRPIPTWYPIRRVSCTR